MNGVIVVDMPEAYPAIGVSVATILEAHPEIGASRATHFPRSP